LLRAFPAVGLAPGTGLFPVAFAVLRPHPGDRHTGDSDEPGKVESTKAGGVASLAVNLVALGKGRGVVDAVFSAFIFPDRCVAVLNCENLDRFF